MPDVTYRKEDRIAHIRLQAAERGNAFTPNMRLELHQALLQYQQDQEAWMAVVSSDGPNFCVGSAAGHPASLTEARERAHFWAGGHVEAWKPLVAAVQGRCSGEGLALALACDLRVAEEAATFEAEFGGPAGAPNIVPVLLINLVGLSAAFDLLWLHPSLDARKAQQFGLVNRLVIKGKEEARDTGEGRLPMLAMQPTIVTGDGAAFSGGVKLAKELVQYAPLTRNFQKEIAYRSIGVPFHYAQSLELGPNPYASEDRIEGTRAFVENRRPVWRNR